MTYRLDWFDVFLIMAAGVASLLTIIVIGIAIYEAVGAEPARKRAEETAWRERCISSGGSLIPTESAWMKGKGTYYTGWICARIERFDP